MKYLSIVSLVVLGAAMFSCEKDSVSPFDGKSNYDKQKKTESVSEHGLNNINGETSTVCSGK